MKYRNGLIIVLIAFIFLSLFLGCQNTKKEPGEITIGALLKNPTNYIGKKVIIYGQFLGFETEGKSKPLESLGVLWLLEDKTGYIYVGGYTGGLNPYQQEDIGTRVKVEAIFREKRGFYYLEIINTIVLE